MNLESIPTDEMSSVLLNETQDFLDSQETGHPFQFPQWQGSGSRVMLVRPPAVERAFQLARSGHYKTISDIIHRLDAEGYFDAEAQLSFPAIRRQLKALCHGSVPAAPGSIDAGFLRRRAAELREEAEQANTPHIARMKLNLARGYEELADKAEGTKD